MAAIRVVLADDHAVVRKGIRDLMQEDGGIVVVAEAGDGETVKTLIETHAPDVAVLDVRMPQATGIEVTRWVRERHLPVRVLILSAYDDDPFVMAALQAGADGYVLKNAEAEDIIEAVRSVQAGRTIITPELAARLVMQKAGAPASSAADVLTERECEVLHLAAAGMTNRAIGQKLVISDRTVQGHLASIYNKLQVNSRTEAVTKALQMGVIQLPEQKS